MNPNDHVLHEQHGHTAVVTINRPDAYNAMNRDVITQLSTTLDAIEVSDTTAMILTGAGKSFVAGADIGELATRTPLEGLNPLLQRTLDSRPSPSPPSQPSTDTPSVGEQNSR